MLKHVFAVFIYQEQYPCTFYQILIQCLDLSVLFRQLMVPYPLILLSSEILALVANGNDASLHLSELLRRPPPAVERQRNAGDRLGTRACLQGRA